MAELLLELFSEEIPARMQARAAEDLRRLVIDGLKAQGLEVGEAKAFATPRRLALVVEGVPEKSPAVSEERKGPRVSAPEQAIAGFLKSAGLKSIGDAQVVKDEKKGDFYVARIDKPGRAADEIVDEVVPADVVEFPVAEVDALGLGHARRWVRPLHSIVLPARRQGGAVRDRRHRERQRHARASLPRQRAVQGDGLRRLRQGPRSSTRSCSIPAERGELINERRARWPRSTS